MFPVSGKVAFCSLAMRRDSIEVLGASGSSYCSLFKKNYNSELIVNLFTVAHVIGVLRHLDGLRASLRKSHMGKQLLGISKWMEEAALEMGEYAELCLFVKNLKSGKGNLLRARCLYASCGKHCGCSIS